MTAEFPVTMVEMYSKYVVLKIFGIIYKRETTASINKTLCFFGPINHILNPYLSSELGCYIVNKYIREKEYSIYRKSS